MKRINIPALLLFMFILGLTNVYAECSTDDMSKIRSEAVQVKVSYEKTTRIMDSSEYHIDGTNDDTDLGITEEYYKIYINNLTENLYITVYNNYTDKTDTYTYQDSDNGTISFDNNDILQLVKYTITVYSSSNTNCPDTQLYITDLTTPRYNYYYYDSVCNDAKDFYLCQEYLTIDFIDYTTFKKSVNDYLEGLIDTNGEEVEKQVSVVKTSFWDKYKIVIIVGGVVIVGIGTILVIKKRGKKKHENEEF